MSKESLGVNNNVTDAMFQTVFGNLMDSTFGYRGYKTRPDFAIHRIILTPKVGATTPSYSSALDYEIPKRAAVLCRVSSRWNVAALAGVAPSFVDYYGFAAHKTAIMRYGSNDLQTIRPLEMYLTNRLDHRRKDQEAIAELAAGDLSLTERQARATGTQQITVHWPFHFSELPDKAFFTEAVGSPLEFQFRLDEFENLVNDSAAGVTGGAISNYRLECEMVHVEDYERDYHIHRTLDDDGLIIACREHNYQPNLIVPVNTTQIRYPLRNLKKACVEIRWVLRDRQQLTQNFDNSLDYFNFLSFALTADNDGSEEWELDASGVEIISPMNEQWNIFVENRDRHSGDSGDRIYGASFSFYPEDKRNGTGHKTWAGMTNPELLINFGGSTAATPPSAQGVAAVPPIPGGATGADGDYIITAISRDLQAEHRIQGDVVTIFK